MLGQLLKLTYQQKLKSDLCLIPYVRVSSKWIRYLKVKYEIILVLKKISEFLYNQNLEKGLKSRCNKRGRLVKLHENKNFSNGKKYR